MTKLSALLATITAAPDPVIELERALSETEASHRAALTELDGLADARQKALEEGDDGALAALRQRRPFLEDERDRAMLAISQLRQKLGEARAAVKQARIAEHRAAHDAAVAEYLKTAYVALTAFDAIVTVRAAAIREGFAGAVQAMELPPNLPGGPFLDRDGLAAFAKKQHPATARRVKATVRKFAPPDTPLTDSQGPVRLGVLPAQRRARRAPVREAADEGAVSLVVVRPGIDLPGRGPLAIGDEIALPKDEATSLLRSGAVDLVPRTPAPIIEAPLQEPT